MTTQTTALAAAGASPVVSVAPGAFLKFSSTGTFTGYLRFERSRNQGASWETIEAPAVDTNVTGATRKNESKSEERYRFRLLDTDAETAVTGTADVVMTDDIETLVDTVGYPVKHVVVNAAGQAKAGTTAGWVVAAGNNIALVTCPASKTASTLVVPVPHLKVGTKIVGFHLLGQVENTAAAALTIDANLRKHTSAAADVTDASVAAITQFTAAADAALSDANTRVGDFEEVVAETETFYFLITATTGVGVDIALQGAVLEVIEP